MFQSLVLGDSSSRWRTQSQGFKGHLHADAPNPGPDFSWAPGSSRWDSYFQPIIRSYKIFDFLIYWFSWLPSFNKRHDHPPNCSSPWTHQPSWTFSFLSSTSNELVSCQFYLQTHLESVLLSLGLHCFRPNSRCNCWLLNSQLTGLTFDLCPTLQPCPT